MVIMVSKMKPFLAFQKIPGIIICEKGVSLTSDCEQHIVKTSFNQTNNWKVKKKEVDKVFRSVFKFSKYYVVMFNYFCLNTSRCISLFDCRLGRSMNMLVVITKEIQNWLHSTNFRALIMKHVYHFHLKFTKTEMLVYFLKSSPSLPLFIQSANQRYVIIWFSQTGCIKSYDYYDYFCIIVICFYRFLDQAISY